jgi:hypothetical protein
MRKNKLKVCFVESSFGQKVWSTFPVAQYCIASTFQNGTKMLFVIGVFSPLMKMLISFIEIYRIR